MIDYTTMPQRMRAKTAKSLLALAFILTGGCAYKIEIQQGNERLLESMDELTIGMSQDDVVALLGPPPTARLFKKNVWIYAYQMRDAGFVGEQRLRSLELVFDDNGVLKKITMLHDDFASEGDDGS